MAVGNNSIQPNLMKVGSLELQHLMDSGAVYFIRCLQDLLVITLTAEARSDQLLAVLVQKIESWSMTTRGDLDQLCKPISDLAFRQGLEE